MTANLVTDILAPEIDTRNLSLMEIISSDSSADQVGSEVIAEARQIAADIPSADPEEIIDSVSRFVAAHRYHFPAPLETIFLVLDLDHDPAEYRQQLVERFQEFARSAEEEIDRERVRALTRSIENSLDYFYNIFQDDAEAVLVDISGVQLATVRRWKATGKINSRAKRKITQLVAIFAQLASELDFSDQEIAAWFNSPLDQKTASPRQLISQQTHYYYQPPIEIRRYLEKRGISFSAYYY